MTSLISSYLYVEGMLYHIRTGIPWRDLPPEFGKWNTVFQKFNDWSAKGMRQILREGHKDVTTQQAKDVIS